MILLLALIVCLLFLIFLVLVMGREQFLRVAGFTIMAFLVLAIWIHEGHAINDINDVINILNELRNDVINLMPPSAWWIVIVITGIVFLVDAVLKRRRNDNWPPAEVEASTRADDMEEYRGYTYLITKNGETKLKLSSGEWINLPSVDYLKAYVDGLTGNTQRSPPVNAPFGGHPVQDTWYYTDKDGKVGPLSLPQLRETVATVSTEHARGMLVWHPSFADWKPAIDVADLWAKNISEVNTSDANENPPLTVADKWPESLQVEFPNESKRHRYCIAQDGSVSAINIEGKRVGFPDWQSFSNFDPTARRY